MACRATRDRARHCMVQMVAVQAAGPHGRCYCDSLRCLALSMRVEAMKKRSRAGGKPVKALPRRALNLKPRKASTTLTRRRSASAGQTEVARLTRELGEAREQQA